MHHAMSGENLWKQLFRTATAFVITLCISASVFSAADRSKWCLVEIKHKFYAFADEPGVIENQLRHGAMIDHEFLPLLMDRAISDLCCWGTGWEYVHDIENVPAHLKQIRTNNKHVDGRPIFPIRTLRLLLDWGAGPFLTTKKYSTFNGESYYSSFVEECELYKGVWPELDAFMKRELAKEKYRPAAEVKKE